MIRLTGKNPLAVIKNPRHHAQAYVPLVKELATELLLSDLNRGDRVHDLWQGRTGPSSFALYLDTGDVFAFRPEWPQTHGGPCIVVYDAARNGTPVFYLANEQDVWAFVKAVEKIAGPSDAYAGPVAA